MMHLINPQQCMTMYGILYRWLLTLLPIFGFIFVLVTICELWQLRQELEKIRRRLEAELADVREQLGEKNAQLEELQVQINKREEELQKTLNRYI